MLFLLSSLVFADVPQIVLDKERTREIISLDNPIYRVSLYSDRSLVERNVSQTFPIGTHIVQFSDISEKIFKDSIRVVAEGAQIYRVETKLVERGDYDLKKLQNMIEKIDNIQDKKQQLSMERNRYHDEISKIEALRPLDFPAEAYRNTSIVYDSKSWISYTQFFSSYIQEMQTKIRTLDKNIADLETELKALTHTVQPLVQSSTKQKYEIIAVIDVKKEAVVTFDISYYTPTSSWLPIYNVYYDSMEDLVHIEQSALFQQESGENWEDVEVILSTAIPNRTLQIPKLPTWTLGEKEEYIPQAYAANNYRPTAQSFPLPQKSLTKGQIEEQRELEIYQKHVSYLKEQMDSYIEPDFTLHLELSDQLVQIEEVPQQTDSVRQSENFSSLLSVGPPSRGGEGFALESGGFVRSAGVPQSRRRESLESLTEYDTTSDSRKPTYGLEASNFYVQTTYQSNDIPVAQSSGVVYNYEIMGTLDIPSIGKPLQIPVDSFSLQSKPFYICTPALSELAYLNATLQHTGTLPILKGNANIFLNGTFNASSTLETTLPNGLFDVPLGADENIRIKRNITSSQRKDGFLINSQDVTDYSIEIDIGNYKNKAIQIRIIEQMPKTNNPKILIGEVSSSHTFSKQPNADGILYWEIEIPPQKTEHIVLNYSITTPKNWILWGN